MIFLKIHQSRTGTRDTRVIIFLAKCSSCLAYNFPRFLKIGSRKLRHTSCSH